MEEIQIIVSNYKQGGSVREIAKKFWEAQEAKRVSPGIPERVLFYP